MKLTSQQAAALTVLRSAGGWWSPTVVGERLRGVVWNNKGTGSAWASPKLKALCHKGLAERRDGWYRAAPETVK